MHETAGRLNDLYIRVDDRLEEFWTRPDAPGLRFADAPVFVLEELSPARQMAVNRTHRLPSPQCRIREWQFSHWGI